MDKYIHLHYLILIMHVTKHSCLLKADILHMQDTLINGNLYLKTVYITYLAFAHFKTNSQP